MMEDVTIEAIMEDVTIEAIKAVDDINRTVYMIGYSCYNVRCIFSDSVSEEPNLFSLLFL